MNTIATWLYLIGTPDRARNLRARLGSLRTPELDPDYGPEPRECPTRLLFGTKISQTIYASRRFQSALDAWDTGEIDEGDVRRWCFWIEGGNYKGPAFSELDLNGIKVEVKRRTSFASSLPWLDDEASPSQESRRSRVTEI